jgi:hypothetical protein
MQKITVVAKGSFTPAPIWSDRCVLAMSCPSGLNFCFALIKMNLTARLHPSGKSSRRLSTRIGSQGRSSRLQAGSMWCVLVKVSSQLLMRSNSAWCLCRFIEDRASQDQRKYNSTYMWVSRAYPGHSTQHQDSCNLFCILQRTPCAVRFSCQQVPSCLHGMPFGLYIS